MKNLKRILCGLLAGATLLLAACSGDGSSGANGGGLSSTGGRFVESEITPEGASNLTLFRLPDDVLLGYDSEQNQNFTSTDGGESWNTTDGPSLEEGQSFEAYTAGEDGTLYGDLFADGTSTPVKVAPDGTVTPLAINEFEADAADNSPYLYNMTVSGDRLLVEYGWSSYGEDDPDVINGDDDEDEAGAEPTGAAEPDETPDPGEGEEPEDEDENEGGGMYESSGSYGYKMLLVDLATGATIRDFSDDTCMSATAADGKLYMLDYDGSIKAYNLGDGTDAEDGPTFPTGENAFMSGSLAMGQDGSLLYLDSSNLRKSGEEGVETVMEGTAYSFGDAGLYLRGVAHLSDGSYVIATQDGTTISGGTKLYKYTWDENASFDPDKTLSIWALEDNALVRATISEFRKKHPDGIFSFETGTSDGAITKEDAIQNLNTRILAGDGPDVILLDGTPAESYATRGMLADMSDMLDTSGLYSNVLEPYNTDSGLYMLPGRVQIPLIAGTKGSLPSSFEALLAEITGGNGAVLPSSDEDIFSELPEEERPAMSFNNLDEAFNLLWNSGAAEMLQNNELNEDTLRAFLEALKAVSDKYDLAKEPGEEDYGGAMMIGMGASVTTIEGSAMDFMSGRSLYGGFTAQDMLMWWLLLDESYSGSNDIATFPGLDEGNWIPASIMGINSGSDKQDLAAEFIQTMLGDSVQRVQTGGGLPVTKTGLAAQQQDINDLMEEANQYARDNYPDEMEEDDYIKPLTYDFDTLFSSLGQPVFLDETLTEVIRTEAVDYCDGTSELDTVVNNIAQSVRNYLAERA